MSTRNLRIPVSSIQAQGPAQEIVMRKPVAASDGALWVIFWSFGLALAVAQCWMFRYRVTADSISYMDMSDGVMSGGNWHRLINGVWSPLYPFLLGLFRRVFSISPANEIPTGHFLDIGFFLFAFICFEWLLRVVTRQISERNEMLPGSPASLAKWAFLSLGYSLFLWASIAEISVRNLRGYAHVRMCVPRAWNPLAHARTSGPLERLHGTRDCIRSRFSRQSPASSAGIICPCGHSLPFLRTGVRRLRWRLWPLQYYSQLAVVYIMFPCPARAGTSLWARAEPSII
jgi:hypothetical protein